MNYLKFEDMVGKTFTDVRKLTDAIADSDAILFTVSPSEQYAMVYHADCCASCYIEDICGDLNDLVGSVPHLRSQFYFWYRLLQPWPLF